MEPSDIKLIASLAILIVTAFVAWGWFVAASSNPADKRLEIALTIIFLTTSLSLALFMSLWAKPSILNGDHMETFILGINFLVLSIFSLKLTRHAVKIIEKGKRYRIAAMFKEYQIIRKKTRAMSHMQLLRQYENLFLRNFGVEMPYDFKIKMTELPRDEICEKTIIIATFMKRNPKLLRKVKEDKELADKTKHIATIKKYA